MILDRETRKKLGERVIYSYFKVGEGYATVAGVKEENNLFFGISLCSPRDSFCKKTGRIQALRRLFSSAASIENYVYSSIRENFAGILVLDSNDAQLFGNSGELNRRALLAVLHDNCVPEWAQMRFEDVRFITRNRNRAKYQQQLSL